MAIALIKIGFVMEMMTVQIMEMKMNVVRRGRNSNWNAFDFPKKTELKNDMNYNSLPIIKAKQVGQFITFLELTLFPFKTAYFNENYLYKRSRMGKEENRGKSDLL